MAQDKNQNDKTTPPRPRPGSVISTEDRGIPKHESNKGHPGYSVSDTLAAPKTPVSTGKNKK